MQDTFTAIDFETAQGYRWSICQVGLVRVENGIITDKHSILVQPPDNYYWYKNTEIHGISSRHTANSPNFEEVWNQIEPYIKHQNVVAHNAFGFDFPCLKQTLEWYGLPMPEFDGHCTYKIFRQRLNLLCQHYQIPLNHHDALSDALACAELYKIHLQNS
ncbi:3'-5' exonuclease [Moheibacter sediminis]|uniref:DNA polymerase-3 subunit epsilon n=1 Tax=Moheibacter sediminis TaxID=1434700 RepID=A0A1W2C8S1_9FLAO|nr:3'-5' exonuclease [Moheibacter sediminis]SMC81384.1 DNA polymerase-3 subunit epsilon [Moheibacter sediminis]